MDKIFSYKDFEGLSVGDWDICNYMCDEFNVFLKDRYNDHESGFFKNDYDTNKVRFALKRVMNDLYSSFQRDNFFKVINEKNKILLQKNIVKEYINLIDDEVLEKLVDKYSLDF